MNKVHGPGLVKQDGNRVVLAQFGFDTAFGCHVTQLQLFLLVKPIDPLGIDGPAVTLQQHVQTAIPIADAGLADLPDLLLEVGMTEDWRTCLTRYGRRFDLIVSSHGPIIWADALPDFCDRYINVGYRTSEWGAALKGSHKIPGEHLSFSTTLWDGQPARKSPGYNRYSFR